MINLLFSSQRNWNLHRWYTVASRSLDIMTDHLGSLHILNDIVLCIYLLTKNTKDITAGSSTPTLMKKLRYLSPASCVDVSIKP